MITILQNGSGIKFTFDSNDHYLQDGEIEVPVNSLSLIMDDSEMFTFVKAQSNDIFLSARYNDVNGGMTREQLEAFFKNNMVASNLGSSISEIYVGTSADTVDANTGVVTKYDGDKQWLNIVYQDQQGYYSMTKINLNEFIIEGETGSGVTTNADGVIIGQLDPRSEEVYTAYDISGNPSTSASVLSVNESGFTVDNIQAAIDGKTLIDRRLYTPKEGVYDNTTQRITFKSDLNDSLFEVQLSADTITIDPTLDSGSTNAVANSAITNAIDEIDSVTSAALNDLNVRIIDVESSVSGKVDTSTFNIYSGSVETALSGKQDTLSAGTNITISGNVISAEGGGGKAIEAGRGISITTGETADTVSFNLPISAGSGDYSVIEGQSTSAMSYADHAEGYRTYAKGSGYAAHAEGYQTSAMTTSSHAEGRTTKASGDCAHAEGKSTVASGDCSHAEGEVTKASGSYSHAEGYATSASNISNVSGIDTYAGYQARHAEGSYALANNSSTHAEGYYTIANNFGEHASGVFNNSTSATTTWGNSGNTLFSVGNGTSNNARHNAFEIRQNGDIYITSGGTDIKLQDNLGGGEVSSAITSGDTNAVAGGAVYDKFDEVEQVTAAALNTLEDKFSSLDATIGNINTILESI